MGTLISGVILAGGANKRFGGITKSTIIIEGEKIISRVIATIRDLFEEITIVTNTREQFLEFSEYKIVEDYYKKAGPLGGIHAGLKSSSGGAIFVFAGDMPFLDKDIIADQIEEFNRNNYDALIPRVGKLIEPLHGIYRKSVLTSLERFLSESNSRAVRDFLPEINTCYFQIKETEASLKAFANINLPSDISGFVH